MNQPITQNELLAKLRKFNKDGKFDEIIKLLEENPNMSMDEIMKRIHALNTNGQFDDLLKFIDGNGNDDILLEDEPDDLFKFLSRGG